MNNYEEVPIYGLGDAPEMPVKKAPILIADVGDGLVLSFNMGSDPYVIGGNPERRDGAFGDGGWDTKEEAIRAFAAQFMELCAMAKGAFLHVRREPRLERVRPFDEDREYWRMTGRFGIFKRKESGDDGATVEVVPEGHEKES